MLERIGQIRAAGATVLADEAFIDYVPEAAITRDAAFIPGVVAVRSLTKFFGCPGLRVGYAVAAPATAAALAAQLSAWPVTTLALHALTAALGDEQYIQATLESNRRARDPLVAALESLGCRPLRPAANFILFEVPNGVGASDIREQLISQHAILVRDCDSFAGLEPGRYLRIAVRTESENSRLVAALASVLGDKI
jgi:threonine-phosphate decarboxylase